MVAFNRLLVEVLMKTIPITFVNNDILLIKKKTTSWLRSFRPSHQFIFIHLFMGFLEIILNFFLHILKRILFLFTIESIFIF